MVLVAPTFLDLTTTMLSPPQTEWYRILAVLVMSLFGKLPVLPLQHPAI